MNYHGKKFRTVRNSSNGETSPDTIFHYEQEGNIVFATYSGGSVKLGHLIGLVDEEGNIDMRYHQVNTKNELMTGTCHSQPEVLKNGKLLLRETWSWTSGDKTSGTSIVEEL